MIQLENIHLELGGKTILEDVSLIVPRGGLVCLFGASGCGKSSILNVVAGFLRPSSGKVGVATKRLAYSFQDNRLAPWLSLRQNILLGISAYLQGEAAAVCVDGWLERLGLLEVADKRPAALSGGMCRRGNLARAFAIAPELLLLDEPFAFLDPAMITILHGVLRELRDQGTTILLVSHVREHIAALEPEIIDVVGPPVCL